MEANQGQEQEEEEESVEGLIAQAPPELLNAIVQRCSLLARIDQDIP